MDFKSGRSRFKNNWEGPKVKSGSNLVCVSVSVCEFEYMCVCMYVSVFVSAEKTEIYLKSC